MQRHAKASGNMWQLHKASAVGNQQIRTPTSTTHTFNSMDLNSSQSSLAQPAPIPFACRHRLPRFPSLHQPWHTLRQGRVTSSCHRWAGSCGCTWAWASQVDSSRDEASSNIMKYKMLFFFKESIWITYHTWIYWDYKPLQTVYSKHTKILKWRQVVFWYRWRSEFQQNNLDYWWFNGQ